MQPRSLRTYGADAIKLPTSRAFCNLARESCYLRGGSRQVAKAGPGFDRIHSAEANNDSYMLVLVVHPSVPATTLKQFVALAKSKPGQISVGNAGAGTPTHLAAELFKATAGINFLQVPYKGAAPANTDLLGGQVVAMFNNPINAIPYTKTGKLRALAVTGVQRLSIAPELPTRKT